MGGGSNERISRDWKNPHLQAKKGPKLSRGNRTHLIQTAADQKFNAFQVTPPHRLVQRSPPVAVAHPHEFDILRRDGDEDFQVPGGSGRVGRQTPDYPDIVTGHHLAIEERRGFGEEKERESGIR